MKLKDLKFSDFPVRVKLTDGFTLDDSFDPGMIVQLNSFMVDSNEPGYGKSYQIYVTVLPEDIPYNKSVAQRNWYDKNGKPCLDYFESMEQFYKQADGSYKDSIFVMENDDFFELVPEKTSEEIKEVLKLAYLWGRDNGEGRSEKNFNDMLETSWAKKLLNK